MAIAIICEYNPFHNGHLYHINETKKIYNGDIICVLSGNFTQRGDITLLNKYKRASHAIYAGADLVVELPSIYSTSSAEYFAYGAIKTLSQIPSVDALSFGCECGSEEKLLAAVNITQSTQYNNILAKHVKQGISYIKSANIAYLEVCDGDNKDIFAPNNMLAMEYIKNIQKLNLNYHFLALKRKGGDFDSINLTEDNFSSASAIRHNLDDKQKIAETVPSYVFEDLKNCEIYYDRLFSIICNNLALMDEVYEDNEGLINRIKKVAKTANSYDELVNLSHTKRYSKGKIRRVLTHIALKHDPKLIKTEIDYLTVLAVSKNKKHLLSNLKINSNSILYKSDLYANYIYNIVSKDKIVSQKMVIV